jgi:hypothetical protein
MEGVLEPPKKYNPVDNTHMQVKFLIDRLNVAKLHCTVSRDVK